MSEAGRAPNGFEVADVALGSNLGDRAAHLAGARAAIAALPGTRVLAASGVEETAPVGPVAQGPYLNQMLRVETALAPLALLDALLTVERAAGRVRDVELVVSSDGELVTTVGGPTA